MCAGGVPKAKSAPKAGPKRASSAAAPQDHEQEEEPNEDHEEQQDDKEEGEEEEGKANDPPVDPAQTDKDKEKQSVDVD